MAQEQCGLPNLIIIGVHKAGTTSLYTYLAKHPEICPSYKKEIGFFLPLMFDRETGSLDEYASHFAHCGGEQYRLEASPSYFYGKEAIAQAISKASPNARIVLILREPADRLVSFFSRAVSKSTLPADINFQDYVRMSREKAADDEYSVYSRGFREGLYFDYIQPWQDKFGRNLKVIFFDDLKANAFELTLSICRWLELETDCYSPSDFTVENKTTQYKHRTLHRYVKDLYMKNERFWRRHHKFKQHLRGLYNFFNASDDVRPETVDAASVENLRAVYAPHNSELRHYLLANNHDSLPEWLR